MRVEIVEERVNKMLDRRELKFRIYHDEGGTPSRKAVYEELIKTLKIDEDKILIPYFRTLSGLRVSEGIAYIFLNGFHICQIEPRYREKMLVKEHGEEKSEEKS